MESVELFETLNETNSTVIEVDATRIYSDKDNHKVILKTTTDPVISDDGRTYAAPAIDVFGNEFVVTWEIVNDETTDESEACNWDQPIRIE